MKKRPVHLIGSVLIVLTAMHFGKLPAKLAQKELKSFGETAAKPALNGLKLKVWPLVQKALKDVDWARRRSMDRSADGLAKGGGTLRDLKKVDKFGKDKIAAWTTRSPRTSPGGATAERHGAPSLERLPTPVANAGGSWVRVKESPRKRLPPLREEQRVCSKSSDSLVKSGVFPSKTRPLEQTLTAAPKELRRRSRPEVMEQTESRVSHNSQALTDVAKALQLDPKCKEAYFVRALLHSHNKDYDNAIADLAAAIDIDPKYARAYYIIRGLLWAEKEHFARAKVDLDKALIGCPESQFSPCFSGVRRPEPRLSG
jgi:tetratricopeptide (TPR) repeat protein